VPARIDHKGRRDVSAQLQRFIDRVPNNRRIVFRSRGVYLLRHGIRLTNRHNLTFDGRGATLRARGSGSRVEDSIFALMNGNSRITIRGFKLVGNNPRAGTKHAFGGGEFLMGVLIWASKDIVISNMSIRRFHGDCVYVGTSVTRVWSERITFRDSTCTDTGRHGVGIVAGRDVRVERVRFDDIALFVVDIEPDTSDQGASRVMIRNNRMGSYGLTNRYRVHMFAACGARGSTVTDVSIIGNRVTGNPRSGWEGKTLALNIVVCGNLGPRRRFTVRDNISSLTYQARWGAPMVFRQVDGVTVTGNRQPISNGSTIATFPGSSKVTVRRNRTRP
jgi:hypothetical protein